METCAICHKECRRFCSACGDFVCETCAPTARHAEFDRERRAARAYHVPERTILDDIEEQARTYSTVYTARLKNVWKFTFFHGIDRTPGFTKPEDMSDGEHPARLVQDEQDNTYHIVLIDAIPEPILRSFGGM